MSKGLHETRNIIDDNGEVRKGIRVSEEGGRKLTLIEDESESLD